MIRNSFDRLVTSLVVGFGVGACGEMRDDAAESDQALLAVEAALETDGSAATAALVKAKLPPAKLLFPYPSSVASTLDAGTPPALGRNDGTGRALNLFVDSSSTAESPDGSRAAPFPRIQQAIDRIEQTGTVSVARGTYAENLVISRKSVAIIGPQDGGAVLAATAEATPAIRIDEAIGASIERLVIERPWGSGIVVRNSANVRLHQNKITEAIEAGVVVFESARVIIANNAIQSTRASRYLGRGWGTGVIAARSVHLELVGNSLTENALVGIAIDTCVDVTLSGNAIKKTRPSYSSYGWGVLVVGSRRFVITRNDVSENIGVGIAAFFGGAGRIAENQVAGTAMQNDEGQARDGYGIAAWDGARADIVGNVVGRSGKAGTLISAASAVIANNVISESGRYALVTQNYQGQNRLRVVSNDFGGQRWADSPYYETVSTPDSTSILRPPDPQTIP